MKFQTEVIRVRRGIAIAFFAFAASCNSDLVVTAEPDPESVKFFTMGGREMPFGGGVTFVGGETARIVVRLFTADGGTFTAPPDGYIAVRISPAELATVTHVSGEVFTYDIAWRRSGGTGTMSIGFGLDATATDLTFGPYTISVLSR